MSFKPRTALKENYNQNYNGKGKRQSIKSTNQFSQRQQAQEEQMRKKLYKYFN